MSRRTLYSIITVAFMVSGFYMLFTGRFGFAALQWLLAGIVAAVNKP